MTAPQHTRSPEHLLRQGVNLERVTLAWNVVGIVVLAVAAVAPARSRSPASGSTAWLRSVRARSCSDSWPAPAGTASGLR